MNINMFSGAFAAMCEQVHTRSVHTDLYARARMYESVHTKLYLQACTYESVRTNLHRRACTYKSVRTSLYTRVYTYKSVPTKRKSQFEGLPKAADFIV